MEIATWNL